MPHVAAARSGSEFSFGPSGRLRTVAFVAIAACHAVLVILLWELRRHERAAGALSLVDRLEIFFVPERVTPPPVAVTLPRERPRRVPPAVSSAAEQPAERFPPEPDSTAITIDWAAEAAAAATRFAAADEQAQRQAKAFSRAEAAPKRTPEFGWSHSRTNRIERMEDGTTLFWISDRCALVNFVFPVCGFGKIEPNADLFEHMDDPPELGDWKDP